MAVCDSSQPSYLGEITAPAKFIVNTEDGKIAAWTEGKINDQFGRMRRFKTVVDRSKNKTLYRGLAITDFTSNNRLYAANFRKDEIEMYDGNWHRIRRAAQYGRLSSVPVFVKSHNYSAPHILGHRLR